MSWSGQELSRNGLKWSDYDLKLTNNKKRQNTFCIRLAWAPKAWRLAVKTGNAQPSSPFLWFNTFTCVIFLLLFVSIWDSHPGDCKSVWREILHSDKTYLLNCFWCHHVLGKTVRTERKWMFQEQSFLSLPGQSKAKWLHAGSKVYRLETPGAGVGL